MSQDKYYCVKHEVPLQEVSKTIENGTIYMCPVPNCDFMASTDKDGKIPERIS
jgi:hypothetical protein